VGPITLQSPLRVVINGGGPAGLALATALVPCPHISVLVLDKGAYGSEGLTGRGYLWKKPHYKKVLEDLNKDLAEEIEKHAIDHVHQQNTFISKGSYSQTNHSSMVFCNRAKMLKVMDDFLSHDVVHYESEALDFKEQEDGTLEVHTSNNETLFCDVLVGADGIWSDIRTKMNGASNHGDGIRRMKTVQIIGRYYDYQNKEKMYQRSNHGGLVVETHFGVKGFLIHLPGLFWFHFATLHDGPPASQHQPHDISDSKSNNSVSKADVQYLCSNFKHQPEALKLFNQELFFKESLYDNPPSLNKQWSKGPVVLTGDAINAVTPVAGNGALEAIKDAIVLKQELEIITDREDIVYALGKYQERRSAQRAAVNGLGYLMLQATAANAYIAIFVTFVFSEFMQSILFSVSTNDGEAAQNQSGSSSE
jgi:2-polyprenyl-6-methoxyphenol hydroxylase-like FAD-dependent oxidoreductase